MVTAVPSEGETGKEWRARASRQTDSKSKGSEEVWRDRKQFTEDAGVNRREWEVAQVRRGPDFILALKSLLKGGHQRAGTAEGGWGREALAERGQLPSPPEGKVTQKASLLMTGAAGNTWDRSSGWSAGSVSVCLSVCLSPGPPSPSSPFPSLHNHLALGPQTPGTPPSPTPKGSYKPWLTLYQVLCMFNRLVCLETRQRKGS